MPAAGRRSSRRWTSCRWAWRWFSALPGSALVLLLFSPNVSGGTVNAATGKAASLISNPAVDFAWFPLANPGLVSIPLGFLFAVVGTLTSGERDRAKWAEMEVRWLTGAHAEKAAGH